MTYRTRIYDLLKRSPGMTAAALAELTGCSLAHAKKIRWEIVRRGGARDRRRNPLDESDRLLHAAGLAPWWPATGSPTTPCPTDCISGVRSAEAGK